MSLLLFFKQATSEARKAAEKKDDFLKHRVLGRIFFWWSHLNEDDHGAVKQWIKDHIKSDSNFAYLARAFTCKEFTMRCEIGTVRSSCTSSRLIGNFIDPEAFRKRLGEIKESESVRGIVQLATSAQTLTGTNTTLKGKLSEELMGYIKAFLKLKVREDEFRKTTVTVTPRTSC